MKNPTLIYDGNCDFCQYCVEYLKLKTNLNVDYVPYQKDTKGLDKEKCAQTIHLVLTPQEIYQGAEAGFKTLTFGNHYWGWRLYQNVPIWAWLSEKIYTWIAKHRNLCFKVAKRVCGNPWQLWRLPFTLLSITTFIILLMVIIKAVLD